MPELSSLFCVALRASCVRFRLPVSPPAAAHCLPATKGSTVLGDRRSGSAGAALPRQPYLCKGGILLCDTTFVWVCPIAASTAIKHTCVL